MVPVKETNRAPVISHKEMEIYELPYKNSKEIQANHLSEMRESTNN